VLSSSKTSRINPDDADGRGGGRVKSLPPPRSGRGRASEQASDAPPRYDSLEIKCRGGRRGEILEGWSALLATENEEHREGGKGGGD
jgi:hypothetical protein